MLRSGLPSAHPRVAPGGGGAAPGSALLMGCRFFGVCVWCLWHPKLQVGYREVKTLFIVLLQGGSVGARAGAPPPPCGRVRGRARVQWVAYGVQSARCAPCILECSRIAAVPQEARQQARQSAAPRRLRGSAGGRGVRGRNEEQLSAGVSTVCVAGFMSGAGERDSRCRQGTEWGAREPREWGVRSSETGDGRQGGVCAELRG